MTFSAARSNFGSLVLLGTLIAVGGLVGPSVGKGSTSIGVSASFGRGVTHHHHHWHRGGPPVIVSRSPWTAAIDAAGLVLRDMLAPPPTAVPVYVGGVTYWRDGGVYYRSVYRSGRVVYVVVPPPPEVVVIHPQPQVADTVIINGQPYSRNPTTYVVQPAPVVSPVVVQSQPAAAQATPVITSRIAVGTVVPQLPSTAVSFRVGGTEYYYDHDVYYLPIRMPDAVRYIVVERPAGAPQM